jgi:hypothetical protein
VDYFAGATNAMCVDVSCQKDPTPVNKEMALYGVYCCYFYNAAWPKIMCHATLID